MIYVLLLLLLIWGLYTMNPAFAVAVVIIFVVGIIVSVQDSAKKDEEIKIKVDASRKRVAKELDQANFNSSKEIYLTLDSISPKMKIDTKSKRVAVLDYYKDKVDIIPFQNLIECQVIEDNETVLSGGVGRAVVGGVIAGGAGAIVGAATRKSKSVTNNMSLKIITSDINNSLIVIPILETATKRDSEKYKKAWSTAQNAHAIIVSIIKTSSSVQPVKISAPTESPLAQIENLAKLKEQGILTEEEFTEKKAELLKKV